MKTILYLLFFSLTIPKTVYSQKYAVLDSMINVVDRIETMSCIIESSEKLEDRTTRVIQQVNASFEPLRCSIVFLEPKKNTRIVYCKGDNNNEIHYEPSGFPYFNLNVDPLGNLARSNNHHTILDIGFSYFNDIIKEELKKSSTKFEIKKIKINDKIQYLVYTKYEDYKTSPYNMKPNETIRQIALKRRISEYQIIKINDNLNNYNDWTDEYIQLPNHFCYEIKIYIDPINWLPLSIKIYDKEGLFEEYNYSKMKINHQIESSKFKFN